MTPLKRKSKQISLQFSEYIVSPNEYNWDGQHIFDGHVWFNADMREGIRHISAGLQANKHSPEGKWLTHKHTQEGNLGVDLVSAARLDKADYPHCGKLGAWCNVCACVRECKHTFTVCLYTLCVRFDGT